MKLPAIIAYAILVCVTSVSLSATLVRDGQPVSRIVLPKGADKTLMLAARELQDHVKAISGAELLIEQEPSTAEGTLILLGPTRQTKAMKLPLTDVDVGYDGYVIKSTGDTLVLCGRTGAGTLNAVYGFLEDFLGVRWYDPGPYGTCIPKTRTITVDAVTEVNRPRFAFRGPWYNGNITVDWTKAESKAYGQWTRRNRVGGVRGYFGHAWHNVIPTDTHFAEHPEYYSFLQGKRQRFQLCTTNADVIRLYSQYVKDRFDRDPGYKYASLSPNDGAGWCECDLCRAVSGDITSRILTFINRVAKNVVKRHPDRLLAFYAYMGIVQPPRDKIQCEPNVMPWVTHYSICQMHPLDDPRCPYQAGFRRILEGWKAISEQLGVREYASWWPVPCAESRRLARDIRYYACAGAQAVSREYLDVQYGTHLLFWLETKLLWNPDQELSDLLDDFFGRFYGPAGSTMRSVYDRLADRQAAASPHGEQWTGNRFEAPRIYPRDLLAEAVRDVEQIESSTSEPMYRQRIQRERLALAAAIAFLDAWSADRAYAQAGGDAKRQRAVARLAKLVESSDALPDKLIVSRQTRQWAAGQLKLMSTRRTHISKPGPWRLQDDYNTGGTVRHDAEELSGLRTGTWGLTLRARGEGYVQYHFVAADGLEFTEAELGALFLRGGKDMHNKIEIRKDDGAWQVFSENKAYSGHERTYPITDYIARAREFRLRIWGRNDAATQALLIDNFEITGVCAKQDGGKRSKR